MLQRIGDYVVARRLAVGGMGEVFLARADSAVGLGRPVVIKTVAAR